MKCHKYWFHPHVGPHRYPMVISLATDTNYKLKITNLFNKSPVYKTENEGDIHTLRNDCNFKYIQKYAVKYNRYIICIYLNINNIHLKLSFKPEIFEDIS